MHISNIWWWHSLRILNLRNTCIGRCCRIKVFTFSGPLETPFWHIFKNTLSIKVSKDNSLQSGALGTWLWSTIFGNDNHDLGLSFMPILEFTGTSIVVDSADEIIILFYFVLTYIITLAIFLQYILISRKLECNKHIVAYFHCLCISIKCMFYSLWLMFYLHLFQFKQNKTVNSTILCLYRAQITYLTFWW